MKKTISILITIVIIVTVLTTSLIATNAISDARIEYNGIVYSIPVGSTISYTCYLQTSEPIVNGEFELEYPSCLKVEQITPKNTTQTMYNDWKSRSTVLWNFTSYGNEVDFTTKKELLVVDFKVVDSNEGGFNFIVKIINSSSNSGRLKEVTSYHSGTSIDISNVSYSKPIEETNPTETNTESPTEITTAVNNTTEPTTEAPTKINPTEPTTVTSPVEETTSVTEPAQIIEKKANTIRIKSLKIKAIKKKVLKKKSKKITPFKITKAKGNVTVSIVKKGTSKKIYKRIKINNKTGVVTFKKGTYAKKTYKIKFKIAVTGNEEYKPKTVNKSIRIKIK